MLCSDGRLRQWRWRWGRGDGRGAWGGAAGCGLAGSHGVGSDGHGGSADGTRVATARRHRLGPAKGRRGMRLAGCRWPGGSAAPRDCGNAVFEGGGARRSLLWPTHLDAAATASALAGAAAAGASTGWASMLQNTPRVGRIETSLNPVAANSASHSLFVRSLPWHLAGGGGCRWGGGFELGAQWGRQSARDTRAARRPVTRTQPVTDEVARSDQE
jgi:hypothetical protein